MRSPRAAFDLRAALVDEVRNAVAEFERGPTKPSAIHRSRVALKRARALARVGSAGAPGLAEVFDGSARSLMRTLGAARDKWVLEQSARDLARQTGKKSRSELNALADRMCALRRATPSLNVDAVQAGLHNLLLISQVWPEASERQVARGAKRLARRARKAWRRAREGLSPDVRHKWRKREKDRLYAAILLGAAWPQDHPRRRKFNAALGQTLGDERDLLLVMERLVTDRPADGNQRALKTLGKVRKRIAKRADKLGRALHATGG